MPQKPHVCSVNLNNSTEFEHKTSECIRINMLGNNMPEAHMQEGIAQGSISKYDLISVAVIIYFYQTRINFPQITVFLHLIRIAEC